jgi:pimeloyl-ACP methyl ester carboxylesterase
MRTLTRSAAFMVASVVLAPGAGAEAVDHVDVEGARFPYVEAGEGEAVLFIPAAWSDHRAWDGIKDRIAADYRFVSYTQRHYGTGDWPDDKPLADDVHGADLAALLRHWDEPMHLVGYSASGSTIFRAAIEAPELVRSIVIFEPTMPEILEGSPEGEAAVAEWEAGFAKIVFDLPEGGFDTLPQHNRMVLLENAHTTTMRVPVPPLTCDDLGNVEAPTLLLVGEATQAMWQLAAEAVADCVPGAEVEVMPDVDHGAPVEASDAFVERLLAFLDRHQGM